MISGADIMIKCLEAEGIDTVFGYPGAAICPFYDSLYKSNIKHVLVRMEQSAVHAANGYSRCSNKVGVCVAHIWSRCYKYDYRYSYCLLRQYSGYLYYRTGKERTSW